MWVFCHLFPSDLILKHLFCHITHCFSILLPRHRRRETKKRKRATLNSSKKNWNSRCSLNSYSTNDSTFKMIISSVTLCCFCRIQEERDERHRLKGRVSRFEPLPSMEGKRSCKFFIHVFFFFFFLTKTVSFPLRSLMDPVKFVPLPQFSSVYAF